MDIIEVKNLVKIYQVHKKEPGLASTFKSFLHRKLEEVLNCCNYYWSTYFPAQNL